MIPQLTESSVKDDWIYEDDDGVRIIHGLRRAGAFAHPATRKEVGVRIKDKRVTREDDMP